MPRCVFALSACASHCPHRVGACNKWVRRCTWLQARPRSCSGSSMQNLRVDRDLFEAASSSVVNAQLRRPVVPSEKTLHHFASVLSDWSTSYVAPAPSCMSPVAVPSANDVEQLHVNDQESFSKPLRVNGHIQIVEKLVLTSSHGRAEPLLDSVHCSSSPCGTSVCSSSPRSSPPCKPTASEASESDFLLRLAAAEGRDAGRSSGAGRSASEPFRRPPLRMQLQQNNKSTTPLLPSTRDALPTHEQLSSSFMRSVSQLQRPPPPLLHGEDLAMAQAREQDNTVVEMVTVPPPEERERTAAEDKNVGGAHRLNKTSKHRRRRRHSSAGVVPDREDEKRLV